MLSFNQHLIESKNTHMEHVEDLIFNEGLPGARKAIQFLNDVLDMLSSNVSSSKNITVKWDGAPAIFAGVDPSDGKFFIAKKGLFNKNPVTYKSLDDIKRDAKLPKSVKEKFLTAFPEFQKLGIKRGVYQGDLMFTKFSLKNETIDGVKYITFQPNTIVYAVPLYSTLGQRITKSNIGVVWHTTYSGKDLSSMKASFGKAIVKKFKNIPSVWQDDATYKDVSGTANFTAGDSQLVRTALINAEKKISNLDGSLLKKIADNQQLKALLKQYNNSLIRGAGGIGDTKSFYKYVNDWYQKEIDKKKTEESKETWKKKRDEVLKVFSDPIKLQSIFNLMAELVSAKIQIINQLNKASSMGTFLKTANGFKATNQEGFVAIDKVSGAVKLVDRLEFSKANFSPEFIKGWE